VIDDSTLLLTDRLLIALPSERFACRLASYVIENRQHLDPWEPRRPESYYTVDHWRDDMRRASDEYDAGASLRLILLDRRDPDGPVLGLCNYRNFVRGAFHSCHLGYSLDRLQQGSGLMYEALDASIKFVFDALNMHRIMANYIPTNERSERLLTRLGFEKEGYAREYLNIGGRWQDHVLTSKINAGWKPPEPEA